MGVGRKKAVSRYHHGNLRAALIEEGLRALKIREWQELSARGLARKVGVSANAAFRHFAGKDDLLAALAEEGFRRLAEVQRKAAAQPGTAASRYRATGRAYVQFARENPSLFRLMFARFTSMQENPGVVSAAMDFLRFSLELMAEVGDLEPGRQKVMFNVLLTWSIVHGLSNLVLDGQMQYLGGDIDEMIDAVVNMEMPLLIAAERR